MKKAFGRNGYSLRVWVDLSRIPRQVVHKTQAAWFRVDDLLEFSAVPC